MLKTFKVNYDFKGFILETQSSSGSFVALTFRHTERILHRSLAGNETLIWERLFLPPSQFQFDIPVQFLAPEESCSCYVNQVLSKVRDLDRRILQRLVPQISANVAEISGGGSGRGEGTPLIEVVMDMVEESIMEETKGWNKMAVPATGGGHSAAVDDGKEEAMSCAVCLEELPGEIERMELPCSHVFHRDCIFRWLRQNLSCPMCRGTVG